MKKLSKFKKILILFVLLIIILYQIPASQKDFFELYKKQDYASKSLKDFYRQQTKSIIIDGVEWKYFTDGSSERTILFLHGMGGAYDLWWQQIDFFKSDYKVISYTLPDKIDNLEDALEGIKAILDKENIKTFTAVGTSMGGYITQYLLKKMPERLDRVVFGNTFPPNDLLMKENKTKSLVIPYLPEIIIDRFRKKSLNEKLLPAASHNDTLLSCFLRSLPFSKKQFINRFYVVVNHFTINPAKYNYKRVPKLIIESNNDPLIPEKLRQDIKELYPEAKVYTFNKEGHFPYINVAKEYNSVLKDFFDEKNELPKIENTVNNYFTGRKTANIEQLQKVFSEQAKLMFSDNKTLHFISVEDYLNKVKQDGAKSVNTKIIDIDLQDNMAYVKTLFDYTDKAYIDYLTLLKQNDSWIIVSKTFCKIR